MGIPTLIKTLTASGDSSLSFVNGAADVTLDGTYNEYMWVFTDIGPATDAVNFQFNLSDDTSSHTYDSIKTSTFFQANHSEDDTTTAAVGYETSVDLAQATGVKKLTEEIGNGADESAAGILTLYSPASTTYVKHWNSTISYYWSANGSFTSRTSGYANHTAAVTAIQFSMSSGNFDGVIQMYGIA